MIIMHFNTIFVMDNRLRFSLSCCLCFFFSYSFPFKQKKIFIFFSIPQNLHQREITRSMYRFSFTSSVSVFRCNKCFLHFYVCSITLFRLKNVFALLTLCSITIITNIKLYFFCCCSCCCCYYRFFVAGYLLYIYTLISAVLIKYI